jgi:hypothetical protein
MVTKGKGINLMKTVIVAGDLVWDNNLVQCPAAPATHHELLDSAILHRRAGGAWYLMDLISTACSDLETDVKGPNRRSPRKSTSQAYQLWSLHEKKAGSKEKVWRISQFMGCQTTSQEVSREYLPDDGSAIPDVLVLDNLCLGFFRENYKLLKAFKNTNKDYPGKIIIKVSSLQIHAPFWDLLLAEDKKHAERLTVVLPARALRERGAAISQGLSWDRTVEETVKEFEHGHSSLDLARCERVIVSFGHEGVASFSRQSERSPLNFERFLYHPREHEGTFRSRMPGRIFGSASIFTAAMVRHALEPGSFPLFIALGRALASVRKNHELGGGENKFNSDSAHNEIRQIFHPPKNKKEPSSIFSTAFPHEVLRVPISKKQPATHSDLLHDLTGFGYEYVAAHALDTVLRGPDKALGNVPMANYGHYLTADREEIERINGIRDLIASYQANPKDRKPLSIAVFGSPGSGKSFAIKQLALELFGSRKAILEFNLSQLKSVEDLHVAFHQVRDASVRGEIPLVFWDEFDSRDLKWLKEFLAPMQDAEFMAGSVAHPFGKAIFVFAGGTSSFFESFDKSKGPQKDKDFKNKKGPDFVSRLRGFVNIKGPNPVGYSVGGDESSPKGEGSSQGEAANSSYKKLAGDDPAHLIRRAILLRSILQRDCPQFIDPETKNASISSSVVRGFLRVHEYLHGARSLEAIVKMSDLVNVRHFNAASLPPPDLLHLHVTEDFLEHVNKGQLELPVIEVIAKACHEAWRKQKVKDGWKQASKRNDDKKEHPWLLPFDDPEFPEPVRESNRITARLVQAKLHEVDCQIKMPGYVKEGESSLKSFSPDDKEKLVDIEHDIWLRKHLLDGYDYAEETNESLRLHRDILPFNKLPEADQELDRALIDSLIPALSEKGYKVVKGKG